MILEVESNDDGEVLSLRETIEARGVRTRALRVGKSRVVLTCVGDAGTTKAVVEGCSTARVIEEGSPHPLVSRYDHDHRTVIAVGVATPVRIGGPELVIVAGPCSVESRQQLLTTAAGVKSAGAVALRGGAYKPRTSPYPFQGMGEEGLELLTEARMATGLPIVTEVMDPRLVERVAECADVLQIGSRNMQNYALLDEVGRVQRPILLKRGISATVEELLLAAERIVLCGNPDVILCERGIRTYERATRNTLDVAAVAVLKEMSHLPVLVDPSHAAGRASLVPALALAGIAAGADGLLVETHINPMQALTDSAQSLTIDALGDLVRRVRSLGEAMGRSMPRTLPAVCA